MKFFTKNEHKLQQYCVFTLFTFTLYVHCCWFWVYTITIYVMVHLFSATIFLLPPTTRYKTQMFMYFILLPSVKIFRYYVLARRWVKLESRKESFFLGKRESRAFLFNMWKISLKKGGKWNRKVCIIVLFLTYLKDQTQG